jgi:predicted alpha/beta-hydrolase family hydrolase
MASRSAAGGSAARALLLAPGAGADRSTPQLVAIDQEMSAAGWVVERMDFPYRLAGRRAPDRAPVLIAAVREAAAALVGRAGIRPDDLVLGGRSMGGRMCSMAVAEGLPAAGLVLVSYPLHPPGRPEKQVERTRHFPSLRLPCLFVSGTRDPFGTPAELEAATVAIPGEVTHVWLPGDHGLRGQNVLVRERIAGWGARFL